MLNNLDPKKKMLITGPSGCGKTTLLKELYSRLPHFCGFWTEEVRDRGVRTGFQIITTWGEYLSLASVNSSSPFKVGKYGVEVENLNKVSAKLRSLYFKGEKNFLLDEIGKMEYFSLEFRDLVGELFRDPTVILVATIAEKDFHPEIRLFKNQGQVYSLRRNNFPEILALLGKILS